MEEFTGIFNCGFAATRLNFDVDCKMCINSKIWYVLLIGALMLLHQETLMKVLGACRYAPFGELFLDISFLLYWCFVILPKL